MEYELTGDEREMVYVYAMAAPGRSDQQLRGAHKDLSAAIEATRASGERKIPHKLPLPVLEGKLLACEAEMAKRGLEFTPMEFPSTEGEKKMPRKKLHDVWTLASQVLKMAPRTLLFGPPGCGKTHVALKEGLRRSTQKVHTVTLTEESAAADLRGMFLPKGGEFVFHDGPAVRALRNGDRLVINEVDHASPDVWSFLLAMLDDYSMIAETLPSGETITPKTGYHVVATMNGKPEDLPDALADRFTVRLAIDQPNPKAFESLPEDLRSTAAATAVLVNERRIGLRSWITFAELRDKMDGEAAAIAVFGDRWEAVLDSLDAARSA